MILHLTSEVAPFYKRGGLGDIVGTLPKFLSERQPNLVISFFYKNRMKDFEVFKKGSFKIEIQNIEYEFLYYYKLKDNVRYYFLNMSDSFLFSDMESLESESLDEDGEKPYGKSFPFMVYLYFAKAALKLIKVLKISPEYMLFHDWHVCGCFAFPEIMKSFSNKKKCNTILLIHNYEFQGEILSDLLHIVEPEIRSELESIFEQYGTASFFALAFKNVDYVATVSKTYAEELMQRRLPHVGMKFLDLIKRKKIYALPNGIDNLFWSPDHSPFISDNYNVTSFKEKKLKAKKKIQKTMGLSNESSPVVLFMARLTEQKGINMLIDLWSTEEVAMQNIKNLLDLGIQLIIYGRPSGGITGNIHKRLTLAKKLFPNRFNYISNYTEERAHQLLAAADIILCPSLFEPCGLVQLYGMSFGAVPIVTPVGGLKDTVIPYEAYPETGTGFYINEFNYEKLVEAIKNALDIYEYQPYEWGKIIERCLKKNYSWHNIIENYNVFLDEIRNENNLKLKKEC